MLFSANFSRALLALTLAVSAVSAVTLPRVHVRKDADDFGRRQLGSRTTRAPAAKRSSTSTALIPGTQVSGLVQAYVGSGPSKKRQDNSLGYFNAAGGSLDPYDLLYVACSRANPGCTPQPFKFTVPNDASELIQIEWDGPDGRLLSLIGLFPDHIGWDDATNSWIDYDMSLGVGNANYLVFSDWGLNTPLGSPPVFVEGAAAGWSETTVFSIDPATGSLGAHWVNTDGSYPDVYMVYSASKNRIYVTGDVDVLAQTLKVSDLEPITLIFSVGATTLAPQ